MQTFHSVIKSLLPRGKFWEIQRKSTFDRLLLALSCELNKAHQFIESLPFEKILKKDHSIGNLSKSFVETQLQALGFNEFEIIDPTDFDLGVVPIKNQIQTGVIFVRSPIEERQELKVGFSAGSYLTQSNPSYFKFERALKSLIPAHVQARTISKRKEVNHAANI